MTISTLPRREAVLNPPDPGGIQAVDGLTKTRSYLGTTSLHLHHRSSPKSELNRAGESGDTKVSGLAGAVFSSLTEMTTATVAANPWADPMAAATGQVS